MIQNELERRRNIGHKMIDHNFLSIERLFHGIMMKYEQYFTRFFIQIRNIIADHTAYNEIISQGFFSTDVHVLSLLKEKNFVTLQICFRDRDRDRGHTFYADDSWQIRYCDNYP